MGMKDFWDIVICEPIGFCSGVERALRLARSALGSCGRVYSLGPLIHNPIVVKELEKQGLTPVQEISEASGGTLVIRSHGASPDLLEEADKLKIKVIDATCPNVARVQAYAKNLSQDGYTVVVVGDLEHPEVKSILAYAQKSGIVYKQGMEIKAERIGVLAQTTTSPVSFAQAVKDLLRNNFKEMRIFNTICQEAVARQKAVKEISPRVDLFLVVGGKDSANTQALAEAVRAEGKPVFLIENKEMIDLIRLRRIAQARRIGIAAGTSTPSLAISEIVEILNTRRSKQ
uniref:4-hydroxy-3-methylbut-2-enyl diphosphate reductase n=1 Tax=candidate division WOR-3 bacterium TaxID=2052148 RepID=A0A7C6AA60_UNCW3